DRADLLAHVLAKHALQLLDRFLAIRLMMRLERAERRDARALDLVRHADDRGLDHRLVAHQRAFDLHRAQPVARDVDDIIHAPHDPEVAALITPRAIAREVHAGNA